MEPVFALQQSHSPESKHVTDRDRFISITQLQIIPFTAFSRPHIKEDRHIIEGGPTGPGMALAGANGDGKEIVCF